MVWDSNRKGSNLQIGSNGLSVKRVGPNGNRGGTVFGTDGYSTVFSLPTVPTAPRFLNAVFGGGFRPFHVI